MTLCSCFPVCSLSSTAEITISGDAEVDSAAMLSLTCNASGNPYPDNIFWVHDGKVLSSNSRVSITTHKYEAYCESKLNVFSVELADGGLYGCIVNGGVDAEAVAVAEINITVREGKCNAL